MKGYCENCDRIKQETRKVVEFPDSLSWSIMLKASSSAEVKNCGAIPPLPPRLHGELLN
jgi:hypothetical protein